MCIQCCEEKKLTYYSQEKEKRNTRFMVDHLSYLGKKFFCPCCLNASITKEIFKRHIKDCFQIIGKQTIKLKIDILLCKNQANSVLK